MLKLLKYFKKTFRADSEKIKPENCHCSSILNISSFWGILSNILRVHLTIHPKPCSAKIGGPIFLKETFIETNMPLVVSCLQFMSTLDFVGGAI